MLDITYPFILLSLISLIECDMEPFVVGGSATKVKKFPHSVFLNIFCEDQANGYIIPWICGASIVNENIILTAAHCLASCGSRSIITVSVGHMNMLKGAEYTVDSYLIHDHYDRNQAHCDLALSKVSTALKFNGRVKRVALMPAPPYFEAAQVAGWGLIDEERNEKAKVLQFVNQVVWKTNECRQLIQTLSKGAICASSGNEYSYASGGDSGSALVVRGYIQIGIVSYKMPKVSRSLVVYTDTGYFYDWIRKNARRLYCV